MPGILGGSMLQFYANLCLYNRSRYDSNKGRDTFLRRLSLRTAKGSLVAGLCCLSLLCYRYQTSCGTLHAYGKAEDPGSRVWERCRSSSIDNDTGRPSFYRESQESETSQAPSCEEYYLNEQKQPSTIQERF